MEELVIEFKDEQPEADCKVLVNYYKTTGVSEPCLIDVFINDMNKVSYTLPKPFIASTTDKQEVVAVLIQSENIKTVVGVSIRRLSDPSPTSPNEFDIFNNYTFLAQP